MTKDYSVSQYSIHDKVEKLDYRPRVIQESPLCPRQISKLISDILLELKSLLVSFDYNESARLVVVLLSTSKIEKLKTIIYTRMRGTDVKSVRRIREFSTTFGIHIRP